MPCVVIIHFYLNNVNGYNGLRYLRWGGDGEAVQPEKSSGVGNCLRCAQNPQRQVHALLAHDFSRNKNLDKEFILFLFREHQKSNSIIRPLD
jgi:hypothetical protein